MASDPTAFFGELAEVLARIQVTAGGAAVPFGQGLLAAADTVRAATTAGRKVIFIGNGGTAATASHQAVDYWKNGGMRAIAFNDASLLTCVSNDFGYEFVFERPIQMFADAGDVLVAMSSSGKSENILRGVRAGRTASCRIVTMSGFAPDNPLRAAGDINFYAPSCSYGHVEIAHLAISHAVVDFIIAQGGPKAGQSHS